MGFRVRLAPWRQNIYLLGLAPWTWNIHVYLLGLAPWRSNIYLVCNEITSFSKTTSEIILGQISLQCLSMWGARLVVAIKIGGYIMECLFMWVSIVLLLLTHPHHPPPCTHPQPHTPPSNTPSNAIKICNRIMLITTQDCYVHVRIHSHTLHIFDRLLHAKMGQEN